MRWFWGANGSITGERGEDINCLTCGKPTSDHVGFECPDVSESTLIDLLSAERDKFEKWARSEGFHTSRAIHKDYENSKLNWMWKAWKEAVRR